jgi:probable rRNA maturation factor
MAILFHTIDADPQLKRKNALKRWISDCILAEDLKPGDVNVIFCSDEHLLEMNRTHLNHDYYTDIITFDFSVEGTVSGDLYISYDRVIDNATQNATSISNETYRVIIHGVMHLCGYKDKGKKDALTMRQQEDKCLSQILKYF